MEIILYRDGTIKADGPLVIDNSIVLVDVRNYIPRPSLHMLHLRYGDVHDVFPLVFIEQGKDYDRYRCKVTPLASVMQAKEAKFHIFTEVNGIEAESNEVDVKVDHDKLSLTGMIKDQDRFNELKKEIIRLNNLLDTYAGGFCKPQLPPFNKENAKKGMVLTLIDDQGNVGFTFPFEAFINTVNGIRSVDRSVTIDADDIKLKGKDVSINEAIRRLSRQTKLSTEQLAAIGKEIIKLAKDYAELNNKYDDFANSEVL